MPIYEYECPNHGVFEMYMLLEDWNKTWIYCPESYCAAACTRIDSLCSVQPDSMWAGQQTHQGYFTSKSEYNKVLKEKNLETITPSELENVRKNVAKAKADKKEKQLNNLTLHLTNELKDVTIDPDGNTLKERNTYVRTRNKSTE